jgi:hypothetical protein
LSAAAAFFLVERLVLASFSATGSVETPTAVKVFLPALPREGYLEAGTTTVADNLGFFDDLVTADGEASHVQLAMAAGTTEAAANLGFVDDLVIADEGEATAAVLTEVVTTATAVPSATAAA